MQSLSRGLAILDRVAASERGLTLVELCDELALKPPTAHNLARTLLANGFLEKTGRPVRYRLGRGCLDLAAAYASRTLLERAGRSVQELAGRFPAVTFTYSEPVAGEVRVFLRVSPERPGVVSRPGGRPMSPYGTASSLLCQAYWTDEERSAYQQRHPFWEEGAALWGNEERLGSLLAEIRQAGVAEPAFEGNDAHLLAVPVFDRHDHLAGCLGARMVLRAEAEHGWSEVVAAVQEAAARLATDPV